VTHSVVRRKRGFGPFFMGDPSARLLMSLRWDTAHSPQSVLLGRRSLRGIVFFPPGFGLAEGCQKRDA